MAETVTNLISQVTVDSNYSTVDNTVIPSYQAMVHLTSTLVISVFNDSMTSKGYAKVGVKTSLNEIAWGAQQTFLSTGSPTLMQLVRLSNTEFLVMYKDPVDNKGYVRHGTADSVNKTITWGTISSAFSTGAVNYISGAYIDTNLAIIVFQDGGDSNKGYAIMASNSSGTISFGTAVKICNTTTTYLSVCKLTTTSAFVCYSNASTGDGLVIALSGTTITTPINTPATFNAGGTDYISCDALSSTSVIVTYTDTADSVKFQTCVCTISGTTITWGSEYVNGSYMSNVSYYKVVTTSPTTFVTICRDGSSRPSLVYGSVSGTTVSYNKTANLFGVESTSPTNNFTLHKIDSTNIAMGFCQLTYGKVLYATITLIGTNIFVSNSNCHLLATGKSGGWTEISSIYFNYPSKTFSTTIYPKLFLNGTEYDDLLCIPFRPTYSGEVPQNIQMLMPNSPIILNDGDKLYCALDAKLLSNLDYSPMTVTAFGIDVVTS